MSEASPAPLLHALADGGVAAVPPERWEDVAVECDARAQATGDARYPVIQQVLLETFEWWDERGGVPRAIANQIQDVITKELPPTLGASSPADGYVLATKLAHNLRALLTGTSDWIERGYVNPPEDS
jgi:hypothetical protein